MISASGCSTGSRSADLLVVDAAERHDRAHPCAPSRSSETPARVDPREMRRPTAFRRRKPRLGRRGRECESGTSCILLPRRVSAPAMPAGSLRRKRIVPLSHSAAVPESYFDAGQDEAATCGIALRWTALDARGPHVRHLCERLSNDRLGAEEGKQYTMEQGSPLIAGVGLADRARKSRWPARLDLMQSATGLVLVLFMWVHMFFVSSILISKDAMWTITRFFEGYFLFGRSYPWIVSLAVAVILGADRRARRARRAQVSRQLPPVHGVPRAHADDATRGHDAVVLAGVHRVRVVLPRVGAPVHHADAVPTASGRTSPRTGYGASICGRSTSCCCWRSNCTAASACIASR